MQRDLASRLDARDAARFVGRAVELAVFDELLVEEPPKSVVLLHGPGGIGKSTLMREVARRATDRGFQPFELDGRELSPVPGELDDALAPVRSARRPLVLLDTWERMSSAGAHLRADVLPHVPGSALVVLAGREPPEAEWFQDGWEHLVRELPLRPMGTADAELLVRSHHVDRPEAVAAIVAWAGGSPLALTLAADATEADPDWRPERGEDHPAVVRGLVRRIIGTELAGDAADAAAVAAIARRVDVRLLREVLPEADAEAALSGLRSLSFAEEVRGGVTLHDLARRALRADLRAAEPERERELRRRLADCLHARVLRGETMLLVDLCELIETPALRWGFGAEGSPDLRVDGLRPGDVEALTELMHEREASEEWVAATVRLFEDVPERVLLVKDGHDAICGYSVSAAPTAAPQGAFDDAVMGPWLAHARTHSDGEAIVWRDAVDLISPVAGDPSSPVLALLNTAAVLRSGVVNPRHLYLPIDPENAPAVAFATGTGAVHVPELDLQLGSKRHECHILDTGPGGVVGAVRATVYSELGLPPAAPVAPLADEAVPISVETVRAALRDLQRPSRLAASPLAVGDTPEARVASVRALVRTATERAFGTSGDEQLQRRILERAYLDPSMTHEQAADAMHLSRATYFRRLRQASERIAEWIVGGGAG